MQPVCVLIRAVVPTGLASIPATKLGLGFVAAIVWAATVFAPVRAAANPDDLVNITGETKQWHAVTLTFTGPHAHERDTAPNPFTDYALNVTFRHAESGSEYRVPGYFAADGQAGETSAEAGDQWRVHFSPDATGTWHYTVHFIQGKHAAILADAPAEPAVAVSPLNGLSGEIEITESDKSGRDLRGRGRLQYVGGHHLRFAGTGEYFFKGGADAPETLLAYADFDGTVAHKPRRAPLKTWGPHQRDWRPGDPTWQNGKGKGLIGAINYLSDQGMNAFSFLTYNAGGDGDNVWPFVERESMFHYDCSKLDQWGIVFAHGQRRGMYLHFKLAERENAGVIMDNSRAMDAGELGPERRLYLREIIARYGHHLALNWNLAEENSQTVAQQRDTAAYIAEIDPYDHLIVTHTEGAWSRHLHIYPNMLGDQSALTGASIQTRDLETTHRYIVHWRKASAEAGKPWVVANDEQDRGSNGTPPDPGYQGYQQNAGPTIHDIRRYALWGTLMAGGAGIEYFFGSRHPHNDLVCEDWRSRQQTWAYTRHAMAFLRAENIPFWRMQNADSLVGNPEHDNSVYCFSQPDELYLVYLPYGGTASLDLRNAGGDYDLQWFNPRTGGALLRGSVPEVKASAAMEIGPPPSDLEEDWLAVLRRVR